MNEFNLNDLSRELKSAHSYVAKIGQTGHAQQVGKLHALAVTTEIHHQRNSGDTNYWKDGPFDAVLAKVIRSRFQDLATEALRLMQAEFDQERVSQKDRLLAELAVIESIEIAARGAA